MHLGLQLAIMNPGPGITDLFSYKVYGDPHKGGFGIFNCNPRCTYCPLVPKRDNFYVTEGSPMLFHTSHFLLLFYFSKNGKVSKSCWNKFYAVTRHPSKAIACTVERSRPLYMRKTFLGYLIYPLIIIYIFIYI